MGDLSGVGNLKYELWDKTLTMGCKCDPGFTGPDCSLKLCRYGVDPLFIPSTHSYSPVLALEDDNLSPSAPHYEKAFVEIIAKDYGEYGSSADRSDAAAMSGNFDLVIYDVYGEKYVLDKLKSQPSPSPLPEFKPDGRPGGRPVNKSGGRPDGKLCEEKATDRGRFARASGTSCMVVGHSDDGKKSRIRQIGRASCRERV